MDTGLAIYGYVQGEIWEKGETETTQESQGEKKGKVDVLRKARKPLERVKRDRPLQRQALLPNGSGVSHPSPSEMWLRWALYHRFYCVFFWVLIMKAPFLEHIHAGLCS